MSLASKRSLSNFLSHIFRCNILRREQFSCTSSMLWKSNQEKISIKTASYLKKMTQESSKKRRKQWYDTPTGLGSALGLHKSKKGPSQGTQRRAQQLSVVLSRYVTSLLNSGEVDSRLPEKDVQIVRVRLAPDLSALNVYWLATGTDEDQEIEKVFQTVAYKLRTILTGLHLMGTIPPVNFIKDFTQARLARVEQLLDRADMGPDHEPTDLGEQFKTPVSLPSLSGQLSAINLDRGQDNADTNTTASSAATTGSSPIDLQTRDQEDLGLRFVSNIYNVEHASLTRKLVEIRRLSDRARPRRGSTGPAEESAGDLNMSMNRQQIQKLLASKKPKVKRESSKAHLASSLYPENTDTLEVDDSFDEPEDYIDEDIDEYYEEFPKP